MVTRGEATRRRAVGTREEIQRVDRLSHPGESEVFSSGLTGVIDTSSLGAVRQSFHRLIHQLISAFSGLSRGLERVREYVFSSRILSDHFFDDDVIVDGDILFHRPPSRSVVSRELRPEVADDVSGLDGDSLKVRAGGCWRTNTPGNLLLDGGALEDFEDGDTNGSILIGTVASGDVQIKCLDGPVTIIGTSGTIVDGSTASASDFQVKSQTDDNAIFMDTSTSRVGINNGSPSVDLDVTGNILASGNITTSGFLNLATPTELTISGGAVTVTQTHHSIDTESDAASDDLDTINGGSAGDIVILGPQDNARSVVVKHGTGNIYLHGAADFTMDHIRDRLILLRGSSAWNALAPGSNNS